MPRALTRESKHKMAQRNVSSELLSHAATTAARNQTSRSGAARAGSSSRPIGSDYRRGLAHISIRSTPVDIANHKISLDGERDRIHGPLLESYRESLSQVPGAPDVPAGALKYGGVLSRAGSALWTAPTLNRRDFAQVWFTRQILIGPPAGETTPVINGHEIANNFDVMQALPLPPAASRQEGGRTRCWFKEGVNALGHTKMDILTTGPWTHVAPKAEVVTRLMREAQDVKNLDARLAPCKAGAGDVTVRVTGEHGDAEMEEYIRLGEAEHDTDDQRVFEQSIGRYVGNVNALLGGRPELELSGASVPECQLNLFRLANQGDLATQFVLDVSAAGKRRHAGNRHSVDTKDITVDATCSAVTVTVKHGKL